MTGCLKWCIRGLVILNWTVGFVYASYSVYFRKPTAPGTSATIGIPAFILADEINLDPGASAIYHLDISSRTICAVKAMNVGAHGYAFKDGVCYSFSHLGDNSDVESAVFIRVLPSKFGSLTRNEVTYASPPFEDLTKELAIDGRIDPYPALAMYHSAGGLLRPWWMVDLMEVRKIYQVSILPRQAFVHRFRDIEIRVGTTLKTDGDLSSYTFLAFYQGPYTLAEGELFFSIFDGIVGRFVSVQNIAQISNPSLQILEVNVKSDPL